MCALTWSVLIVLAASFAVLGLGAAVGDNQLPAVVGENQLPSADHGARTKRLTTFGKSANMPSPAPPLSAGIVVGASGIKECRTTLDCEMIQYTECRTDPREGRSVCLCMDNALPVNGACSARPRDTRGYVPFGNRKPNKALRTPCNSDNECLEGAECVINPNATVNINQRMCYCMPGWLEVDGYCNGSSINSASILIALTFAVLVATFSQI
ncbi:hypothetical protein LSTR_LSTR009102 [Laodelphax striatellus]|uniref:EGF-like domain-containing protein n=1 Tax=Laodelphax striatellus TaxID=195883 RepID=A0A482XP96_LAOST|nr:hypothetical protein LSTR_LSTR009102 [Laodelphax striatellus]